MTRHALDVLSGFAKTQQRIIIARAVEMMARSTVMQRRRRGLPLACPFTFCHWEASRRRLSRITKTELRDHLLASHSTALLITEDR